MERELKNYSTIATMFCTYLYIVTTKEVSSLICLNPVTRT